MRRGTISAIKCIHIQMSKGRRYLDSLKRVLGKPGQPGSHVNQIPKTDKNNIRGEISPLACESARFTGPAQLI